MVLREPLCACVRVGWRGRVRPLQVLNYLTNSEMSVKNFKSLGATSTRTISFTTIDNNNTERVRTSEVGAIPAPLNRYFNPYYFIYYNRQ